MAASSYLKFVAAALAFSTLASAQTKVVITNDDGWATATIRAEYNALTAAGFNTVLSCPAENKSGSSSIDLPPSKVGSSGCEFQSCPAGSPPQGFNATDPRLNYVNSFPVTSVKYGIQTLAPQFFNGAKPDLVISGTNVGGNTGLAVLFSGTVGAATEAAKEGIPALAFSGASGEQVSYTTLSTPSDSTTAALVYADLTTSFTQKLLAAPGPILPANTVLNINYPKISDLCQAASAFKFVLTRINGAIIFTPPDVQTCGTTRLPTEGSIVAKTTCLVSVSVMNAQTKGDADAATQKVVLDKLGSVLTCA